MSLYRIQGKLEKKKSIYYEFDTDEEPLGAGGMGRVFKGRCVDEIRGSVRDVAVKFMYDDMPESAIERARREASIQLRHDNLVEMLGFIETEERSPLGEIKRHYHVVSELLCGVMLDDLLQGKITDRYGNVVPLAQKLYGDYQKDKYRFATFVIRSVLSGLMALHDAGYIHRDIDPTNIMITNDGHVKLIDFGISKQMRQLTSHDKSLTVAGVFLGKPEYSAPELVMGDIRNQTQVTDIYAIGILLFQCIVGHVPFEGDRHEVLSMQLHNKMPLHLIKNKQMRRIIEQATDKTRTKRFQSAAEFRVALDHLPTSLHDDVFEWKKLYTIVASMTAIIIGAVIVILFTESIHMPASDDTLPPPPKPNNIEKLVVQAIHKMYDPTTAQEGLYELERFSLDSGNTHATYVLSRIYFQGQTTSDIIADTIKNIQAVLQIEADNVKAHKYLEDAVRQDSTNYRALYELGCDYLGGDARAKEYSRDTKKAKELFERSMEYAKQANDSEYKRIIQLYLNRLSK